MVKVNEWQNSSECIRKNNLSPLMIIFEKNPALLAHGESANLEFKASFDRETIETVVAFANARGGTILVGVGDNGSIRGVTVGKETLNDWLGQIKSATSPMVIPDIEAITLADKSVVAITVGEYPVKPVNTRGKYFKRVASSNHQLSLSEITDMYMQSLQLSWDAHVAPKASRNDLSLSKIETFIDKVNQSDRFMLDQFDEQYRKVRQRIYSYPQGT